MPKLNINVDKQKAKRYFGRTVMAGLAGLSLFDNYKNKCSYKY